MVSVAVTPNPFATASNFSQVFDVATATVTFTTPLFSATVFIAADSDVLIVKSTPTSTDTDGNIVPDAFTITPNVSCYFAVMGAVPPPPPKSPLPVFHLSD
jgi:hypothetical protein